MIEWEKLSKEQQNDVDTLRTSICDLMVAKTEEFYKKHPELIVQWHFTLDAFIRETK